MHWDLDTFKIRGSEKMANMALMIGLAGLALSAYGYIADRGQFFYSYLTSFMYWLTIGLGALFFTLIHYLANAKWSIIIKRWSETVMFTLPFMGIMFIPICFGLHDLYEWSHEDVVATDHLLQGKAAYLNVNFFLIRSLGYFVIWGLLTWFIRSKSIEQDQGYSESSMMKVRRVSAFGMIMFALTISFASIDWIMSLSPHWYSTIFGVYMFAGAFVSFLSFTVLAIKYFEGKGILKDIISVEHYHDIGKLMFAFIIFWSYMAFSQYFLIWYAHIPEETFWFLDRWEGTWKQFSMLLMIGHFPIPFLGLIVQNAKRNKFVLPTVAIWIMFIHWVDMYWLILPTFSPEGFNLSWMDATTFVGIGGTFIWFVISRYSANSVIPINDPHLGTSIRHTS